MKDILLNRDGDLVINATGNIEITDSVAQAIIIRLRWFFNEWRFAPQYGVPYFEEVLVKNPSDLRVRQIIRDEILSVEEVESVSRLDISSDLTARRSLDLRRSSEENKKNWR